MCIDEHVYFYHHSNTIIFLGSLYGFHIEMNCEECCLRSVYIVYTSRGYPFTFNPTHPSTMYYVVREETFEHWPRQMKQKSTDLSQNGIFYTGRGDMVCLYSIHITC
jgi:hypothetical protein